MATPIQLGRCPRATVRSAELFESAMAGRQPAAAGLRPPLLQAVACATPDCIFMHTPRPHDKELKFSGSHVSAHFTFRDTSTLTQLPVHSRMFSRASLTVRVSGISPDTESTESLKQIFQKLGDVKPKWTWFQPRHETPLHPLLVSVARHGDSDTGTITLQSEDSKKRALKRSKLVDWSVDDTFAGLTVLHSAPEPDLE